MVGDDRRIHHKIHKVRDTIFAASNRNQKCGVLDHDCTSGCQQIAQLVQQPPHCCNHQWVARSLFPEHLVVYQARRQTKFHVLHIWTGPPPYMA